MQEGNVFTGVCHTGGPVPCHHYPWCIEPRCTYPPPPHTHTSDLGTYLPLPLLLTSSGHHWKPVQTCSLEDLPPSYWYWHLVVATEIRSIGKRALCIIIALFRQCDAYNEAWECNPDQMVVLKRQRWHWRSVWMSPYFCTCILFLTSE